MIEVLATIRRRDRVSSVKSRESDGVNRSVFTAEVTPSEVRVVGDWDCAFSAESSG